MAKKIIVILFSILIFNTCMGMTTKQYSYQTDKKDKTINIVGQLIDLETHSASSAGIFSSTIAKQPASANNLAS